MDMEWSIEIKTHVMIPDELKLKIFEMILRQGELKGEKNMVELIKLIRVEMGGAEKFSLRESKDLADEIRRRIENWAMNRPFARDFGEVA